MVEESRRAGTRAFWRGRCGRAFRIGQRRREWFGSAAFSAVFRSSLAANPDAPVFDEPELLGHCVLSERGNELLDDLQNPTLVLTRETQDDDARRCLRRIGPNIREVEIQGDEHATLGLADLEQGRILLAAQRLVEDAEGVVAVLAQQLRDRLGQILIDLGSHAAVRPGRATIRSRASSAA